MTDPLIEQNPEVAEDQIHKGLVGVYVDTTRISKINVETNSLIYHGYPVQDLAANCRFEEVAYLMWHGELPDKNQLAAFEKLERGRRKLSPNADKLCSMFKPDTHPMASLRTTVSFVGTEYPNVPVNDPDELLDRAVGLMAEIPTLIAATHRYSKGEKPIPPDNSLGFAENFFHMLLGDVPEPEIIEAFNTSLILYAEHSFNVSTFTARTIASSLSGMYSAVTGAIGSLKGPLHGGANEEVMHMMLEIGGPEKAKDWLLGKLQRKEKVMGFGHRVYRNGDSRVPIMKKALEKVAAAKNSQKWLDMYNILEQTMIAEKGIHPNVDFPSGPAYYMMGIDIPLYTPIFVMARITGWTAHIMEQLADNKLIRPLSVYNGPPQRDVVPLDKR